MFRMSRLFIAISLFLFTTATTGCFRAVKYEMGGRSYLSRTEVESAHRKIMEERLSVCQLANHQVGVKCILVNPTRRWIRENYIKTRGLGPKADMLDWMMTALQREIETEYKMIIKSGLFISCNVIDATVGNGENEHLASSETLEIRAEANEKRQQCYLIIAPGGQHSNRIGAGDLINSAVYGWDWFADQIEELISK